MPIFSRPECCQKLLSVVSGGWQVYLSGASLAKSYVLRPVRLAGGPAGAAGDRDIVPNSSHVATVYALTPCLSSVDTASSNLSHGQAQCLVVVDVSVHVAQRLLAPGGVVAVHLDRAAGVQQQG